MDIAKESFTTTFRHRDSSIQTVQGMIYLGILGPELFPMIDMAYVVARIV